MPVVMKSYIMASFKGQESPVLGNPVFVFDAFLSFTLGVTTGSSLVDGSKVDVKGLIPNSVTGRKSTRKKNTQNKKGSSE